MPRRRPRNGNRTDLQAQPVQAASGQQYGRRKQQEDAQREIPLPEQQVPRLDLNKITEAARRAPVPQGILATPTEDPDEPVTAGLPFGPGPGPEALTAGSFDPVDAGLRALYQAYPNESLRRLIETQITSRDNDM